MGPWYSGPSSGREPDCNSTNQRAAPPPSSYPGPGSNDNDDDDNPFIAFRRAVDDRFRVLASSISTIPSILHDLQARGEAGLVPHDSRWTDDSFAARAEQPLAFLSQHFERPSGHDRRDASPPSDEALSATRTLLLQSREACANAGVHPASILRLYRDPDSWHPFFAAHEPTWLSVRWFHASPYSPTSLETHPLAHQHGSMWRAAFEDLLSASTDREPVARDAWTGRRADPKLYESWAQTPRDWMLGLQCRGILPPQLPGLYRLGCTRQMDRVFSALMRPESGRAFGPWGQPAKRDFYDLAREVGTIDADEQPQQQVEPQPQPKLPVVTRAQEQTTNATTELDAYEHFLGKASSGSITDTVPAPDAETAQQQPPPRHQPSVVSTFSTTERTTNPDGSMTTKVLLRKIFADGSEHSTESVSTMAAQGSDLVQQQQQQHHSVDGQREKARDEKKKSGWFWN
ncbi:hypothetical protein ANO11243_020150 [Dothideomycetidae sp. 11243]|nr:hypothetical protein ANO11243_020150 [fungal sp. No.11243]